jgi:D-alanyl-D-alanine dipeptidase
MTGEAFGEQAPLRVRPIPDQAGLRQRKRSYRDYPLVSSPASREPLVDLKAHGLRGENYYASDRNPPHYSPVPGAISGIWVRLGVAARLRAIDEQLRRSGLALYFFDGWRPTEVQAYFHDRWMPEHLRACRPELTEPEIKAEVEKYWAEPTRKPDSPSPHITGGAVDLTLCWADTGLSLWMGSLFDDVTEIAHTDHFEKAPNTLLSTSAQEARANRRLLYWTMVQAGFSAHPNEWWHFSFGDQMWACLTGAPAGFYGIATLDAPRAAEAAE